jgi:hypothetical protein
VVNLAVAERSGRLVEDKNSRLGSEGFRDLNQLLLRHAQPAGGNLGVDFGADCLQDLHRPLATVAPVDAAPEAGRLDAKGDILGNRKFGKQRGLLIDRRNPQILRALRIEPGHCLSE